MLGCKKLTSKVLCYRNWSDCLAAMTDAAPSVVVGALPADLSFDKALVQCLQQENAAALVLLATVEQMDRALYLFQQGAFEYLPATAEAETVLAVLSQAVRRFRPVSQNTPLPQ